MNRYAPLLICLTALAAVAHAADPSAKSLKDARAEFGETSLKEAPAESTPVKQPPEDLATLAYYPSPLGPLPAYLAGVAEGEKRPAIVWLTGGFSNAIDPYVFEPADRSNDQTASAFWKAGVVTMYPTRRGGNGSLGKIEYLYGEVNDVLAAAEWLAEQPGVDPERIYVGGHSTGGTTALLAAEMTDRFRGVFSLGPTFSMFKAEALEGIGVDKSVSKMEADLRAPGLWLSSLKTPTWIVEGSDGNADSLRQLIAAAAKADAPVTAAIVRGETHFTIVAGECELFAEAIIKAAKNDGEVEISRRDMVTAGQSE